VYFLFLFCNVMYSCLSPIFVQVYWPLPPGGNSIAINKYHVMSINISQEHSAVIFRTTVTIDSATQRHVSEQVDPQLRCCDNLKSRYEIFFNGNEVLTVFRRARECLVMGCALETALSATVCTLCFPFGRTMICELEYVYIQGVPGGMCQTSGGCSLC
jgi:hypothetical protein